MGLTPKISRFQVSKDPPFGTLINGDEHIGEIKYKTFLAEIKKTNKQTSQKTTTTRSPGLWDGYYRLYLPQTSGFRSAK